jgi:hypothetical protein
LLVAFFFHKSPQRLKWKTRAFNSHSSESDVAHGSTHGSSVEPDSESDIYEILHTLSRSPSEESCGDHTSSRQIDLYAEEFQTIGNGSNENVDRISQDDDEVSVDRISINDGETSHYCFYCGSLMEQLEQHWFTHHPHEYAVRAISLASTESVRVELIDKLTRFGDKYHRAPAVQSGSNAGEPREFYLKCTRCSLTLIAGCIISETCFRP